MEISVDRLSTCKVQSALLSNAGIAKECNQGTCSQGRGLRGVQTCVHTLMHTDGERQAPLGAEREGQTGGAGSSRGGEMDAHGLRG